MKSIELYFQKLFEGIDIPELERREIEGMYIIKVYTSLLELLLGLRGEDGEFRKQLADFFNEATAKLDEPQQKLLSSSLQDYMTEVLIDITKKINDNVDEDIKTKITANLNKMLQEQTQKAPEVQPAAPTT